MFVWLGDRPHEVPAQTGKGPQEAGGIPLLPTPGRDHWSSNGAFRTVSAVPPNTITPTQLATEIWGQAENESHSRGARLVRKIARELFPEDAPGMGGQWAFTPAQADRIRAQAPHALYS